MKRLACISAIVFLAACSSEAPAPEADTADRTAMSADATAPDAMPTTTAADGKPSYGKFEVTLADGKKITSDVKPDGTYSITDADGTVVDTGKWEQKSPETYCETSDKDGSAQVCYSERVDADGVYTSTDPNTGDVATVVRVS